MDGPIVQFLHVGVGADVGALVVGFLNVILLNAEPKATANRTASKSTVVTLIFETRASFVNGRNKVQKS